ncbi:MAG: AgmX/PglI C-terminal domain-containing protein [Burkholderiales bacterium]
MSAAAVVSFRKSVLPWSISLDDLRRSRRVTNTVLIISAIVCLILLLSPVVKPDRTQPQELPPRLAKLVMEQAVPPPVAVKPKVESAVKKNQDIAVSKVDPKPAPKGPAPRKIEEQKGAQVPEARRPIEGKPPGEIDLARRKAAGIGLLAMKDELAEMHGAPLAVQLQKDIKQGPGVGTTTGPGVGAGNEAGLPDRRMITSNATGGSGGINTAAYSRNTGGGGLAGRSTTMVEGVAGGGGGGGPGGGGMRGQSGNGKGYGPGGGSGGTGSGAGGNLARGGSGKASRSIEEIKLVFERNKGSIYAIYNRALREEPSLQGKVVVKLTISPAGSVVDVRVESSELKTPELEAKLLARIRQFDFGAKDVDQMVVTWPVDFLPS